MPSLKTPNGRLPTLDHMLGDSSRGYAAGDCQTTCFTTRRDAVRLLTQSTISS